MISAFIAATLLFIKWNVLAAITAVTERMLSIATRGWSANSSQTLQRSLLLAVFFAPIIGLISHNIFPEAHVLKPAVQVGYAPSSKGDLSNTPVFMTSQTPSSHIAREETKRVTLAAFGVCTLCLLTLLWQLSRIIRDRRSLRKIIRSSHPVRSIGRVDILVQEEGSVPFTTNLNQRAVVVMPMALLQDKSAWSLAIKHELQHHRSGDLRWNLLGECLRACAGWNPIVRNWLDRIEEVDELACDEALLGRQGFKPTAYATCLYQVARAALSTRDNARLVGTAGMAVSHDFLKRRIDTMFSVTQKKSRPWAALALGSLMVLTTSFAAVAGQGLVSDKRIDMKRAEKLAAVASSKSDIPIVVNNRVLYWLNQTVGNPRARFWARNTLKRMKNYEAMVTGKLSQANLPTDLKAVPALESGYQNTETVVSAGIWQFIPSTARTYGLRVDDEIDERLDPVRLTDAAVAYYTHLNGLFGGDWTLSLLAYNFGERAVQDLIKASGHTDVFKWADEGRFKSKETEHYVPKMMALLIIMKNPDLIKD